jgi:hypothetical protein
VQNDYSLVHTNRSASTVWNSHGRTRHDRWVRVMFRTTRGCDTFDHGERPVDADIGVDARQLRFTIGTTGGDSRADSGARRYARGTNGDCWRRTNPWSDRRI